MFGGVRPIYDHKSVKNDDQAGDGCTDKGKFTCVHNRVVGHNASPDTLQHELHKDRHIMIIRHVTDSFKGNIALPQDFFNPANTSFVWLSLGSSDTAFSYISIARLRSFRFR